MVWTKFWDMHSGGGTKEYPYEVIYIEAPEEQAKVIFYNRFGHNPERVSCTCCGEDYSIDSAETFAEASGFHRGCAYAYTNIETGEEVPEEEAWVRGKGIRKGYKHGYVEREAQKYAMYSYKTEDEYLKQPDVLVIYDKDIKDSERFGTVPEERYVWV